MNLILAQMVIHQFPGYAVGWGTLSLINAGLAQSKGRSGLTWWFVSLFLGPIATFLIVAFLDAPRIIPVIPVKDVTRDL